MSKIWYLQSIILALIMFTGVTGTTVFAEHDKSMYDTEVDKHKKEYMTVMAGGYERSLNITKEVNSYMVILNTEYQKIKTEFASNDSLTAKEKYDIQVQFIENAKSTQIAWVVPHN